MFKTRISERFEQLRAISAGLDLEMPTFARLAPAARGIAPLVAESGVRSAGDVRGLAAAGASAFLVGEALATARDPAAATRALVESIPPAARLVGGPGRDEP